MRSLKEMQDILIHVAENQLTHLETVKTDELGEVIDMIKDLEEAIYYCAKTEHLYDGGSEYKHTGNFYKDYFAEYPYKRLYEEHEAMESEEWEKMEHMYGNPKEGKSPKSRRKYMEAKEMHKDKNIQLQELENYIKELSKDIIEMIEDASQEERQYLSNRISALASKVNSLKD